MKQRIIHFLQLLLYLLMKTWRAWLAVAVIIVGALWLRQCRDERIAAGTAFRIETSDSIDVTPEEIRAVRQIGQWEFLCVEAEELAELHESHLLGDKHLVRIYQGRLRIGSDLSRLRDDDFQHHGDTLLMRLPDVALLDSNFIDETRTRSFYERGTWSNADRERLYQQAHAAMLRRTLTPARLEEARRTGRQVVQRTFQALGFKEVVVTFREEKR